MGTVPGVVHSRQFIFHPFGIGGRRDACTTKVWIPAGAGMTTGYGLGVKISPPEKGPGEGSPGRAEYIRALRSCILLLGMDS